MEMQEAIYIVDLIEMVLRAEPGTAFGQARDQFMLTHGNFGLEQLSAAEKRLREFYEIPESTGNVYISE